MAGMDDGMHIQPLDSMDWGAWSAQSSAGWSALSSSDVVGSGSRRASAAADAPATADGHVEACFQEHERPIGLVLSWFHSLPVVDGILPNTPAQMRPQIVPGLCLVAINGYILPRDVPQKEVEDQLQLRPLILGFNVMQPDGLKSLDVPDGSPMHAYQVEECYRAIVTLVMRESEDLKSKVVAKAGAGAILQVLEYGEGDTGRRLRAFSGGISGWISCMSPAGLQLLDSNPANESEVDINEEYAEIGNALPMGSEASPQESNRPGRHDRFMEICYERSMLPQDDDSDEGFVAPKIGRIKRLKQMISGQHESLRNSLIMLEPEDTELGLSSEEDLPDLDPNAGCKPVLRKSGGDGGGTQSLLSRRDRAFFRLCIEEFPEDRKAYSFPDPFWVRVQRKLWLIELRVQIMIKTIQIEEEGPRFEEIWDIATSFRFEIFIGVMICANALCMALETFYPPDGKPGHLAVAEHLFTFVFVMEFFTRILAFSWIWLFNAMNIFDTFLVWVTGVLVVWILGPAGVDIGILRRLGAFRILRLARLCRAVRLMQVFRQLWILVQGIMGCASLLFWSIFLGGVVHFTFAVAVIELVSKEAEFADNDEVQRLFGGLPRAMCTLFQIMIFDGWASKVKPIVMQDPKSCIIFLLFMGLAGIVLFNLMTAIVVRNAFDSMNGDEEAVAQVAAIQDHKMRTELTNIFLDLDEDQSGCLSIDEFLDCMDDFSFVRKMKMLDIDLEELPDIFDILDDGDGQVDQTEFIQGMLKMQGPALSGEMLQATCSMRNQNVHFIALEDAFVQNAMQTFRTVETHVDCLHRNMNSIMYLTAEVVTKIDLIGIRGVVGGSTHEMPFLMDPEEEDIKKAEKKKLKIAAKQVRAAEKAQKEGRHYEPEPELPEGSYVEDVIPATWILRNKCSPLAKNPGKVRLAMDPSLKDKLLGNKVRKHKKVANAAGVSQSLGRDWQSLDLPLDEEGVLDASALATNYDTAHGGVPEPPPRIADMLQPWHVPPSPSREAWGNEEAVDASASLGLQRPESAFSKSKPSKAADRVKPSTPMSKAKPSTEGAFIRFQGGSSALGGLEPWSLASQADKASPGPSHPNAVHENTM